MPAEPPGISGLTYTVARQDGQHMNAPERLGIAARGSLLAIEAP
jgi:hypothetical protein